ncbi:MAG: pyruvate, phosphate dikinase [Proteobacteria bacterium]|nr:pyruvate, phosphate dikinase [Pseudomonadota bacterium]
MDEIKTPESTESLISTLKERSKELTCLYRIEELLSVSNRSIEEVLQGVIEVIPPGWQFPEVCQAEITYYDEAYRSKGFVDSVSAQCSEIIVQELAVGKICVSYREEMPPADDGPFLNEEAKLLEVITGRLGQFIQQQKLNGVHEKNGNGESSVEMSGPAKWKTAIDILCKTDQNLLNRVSRKMINYLMLSNVKEAKSLLQHYGRDLRIDGYIEESNQPRVKTSRESLLNLIDETFRVASNHLEDEKILDLIQKWIHEDKTSFLVKPLVNVHATLTDIADAMQRYQHLKPDEIELSDATAHGMKVAMIRRFLTEQLSFINVAKNYVELDDFFDLIDRLIYSTGSHGKLGGKSAGLFLGSRLLSNMRSEVPGIGNIKTPKTWYITSEGLHEFVYYNNLEEFYEQKYKKINEVKQDYPHIVQVFKNSHFPMEIVKGLSMALDDFGDAPLIVRSSSLLEDRLGAAFSGKYLSLFLANQGEKRVRLEALMDAIAEVYASTFGPDPIEYRAERGLLDFNEQMAIMIQEVVGNKVGRYFFPAFAGVAFSRNEFRWSPRIKRDDGLLRIVPGIGTRAVDRLIDDYPVLIAVRQPNLRVNVTEDELIRYSPKMIDVINLEKNRFETIEIADLLKECGSEYPSINNIISINRDGIIKRPVGMMTDFEVDDVIVTFDGLITNSPFVAQVDAIMSTLSSVLNIPVDIEFASDGKDFYLLQCRPQSYSRDEVSVTMPRGVPSADILFTANRYVSDGSVVGITHIVYVDPIKYSELAKLDDLNAVGRTVGRLNKILPKRKFILIGPGRWGSRGDIKLGVRVTYSDINNTAMLIEVARKKGNYVPDLSFGTHFFQDLVEASIRYLPLYPDNDGIEFNEKFLLTSENVLKTTIPESAHLADVIRVIDVPSVADNKILNVLMNADDEEAIGMFIEQ